MISSLLDKIEGKAKNLQLLKEKGFLVPDFLIIPSTIHSEKELLDLVEKKYSCKYFAVRSSANIEDGKAKSYAGHFYSAIGVDKTNLFKEYKNVIKSFGKNEGFVIIQKFINSTKSGVLFTNDGNGNILVNSNIGLCKTVVEGNSCDEFIASKKGKVISQKIETNKKPLSFKNGELTNLGAVTLPSLSIKEIKELVKTGIKIEKKFKCPQDIEWCYQGDKLYILQTRPITASINSSQELTHYDSANIAESYSGIILPLTISFAGRIYKTVYINLLRASGASHKKIKRNIHIFNKLVQDFYGRIFYNMNNWYLMMSFIPGYSRNKENMEDMITSNVREEIAQEIKPSLLLKLAYPLIVIFKMVFFAQKVKRFKNKVYRFLKYFRSLQLHSFNLEECLKIYHQVNTKLLEKWHITVENDFIMMTYLGTLKKKIEDEQLQQMLYFDNKSAAQILELKKLSSLVYSVPELKEHCINLDKANFEVVLNKNPELKAKFDSYFLIYGGRFANELKLESSDIEEDKKMLLQILNLYKSINPTQNKKKSTQPDSKVLRYTLKRFKHYASQREKLRLLRSNCFSVMRKIFLQIGNIYSEQGIISSPNDIFYLKENEILNQNKENFSELISSRKEQYLQYNKVQPLPYFSIAKGENPPVKNDSINTKNTLKGRACSPGNVQGKVRVFKEYQLPKSIDFDIMVSKNTDPGWVTLIALSKGLIIEHGGVLSHAAIVSRELGIPTVIGVENATEILKDMQTVEMNGNTGTIQILG